MPRRPRSHALEAESRVAFRACCPSHWVVEDVNPDYGLAMRVSVFDARDGTATGLGFAVQLKATDAVTDRATVRLPVDHLESWAKLDVPVLIVAYHRPSRRFRGIWSWDVRLTPDLESQATVTLKPGAAHTWTEAIQYEAFERDVLLHRAAVRRSVAPPVEMVLSNENGVAGFTEPMTVLGALRAELAEYDVPIDVRPAAGDILPHAFLRVGRRYVICAVGPRWISCETRAIDWSSPPVSARDLALLVGCLAHAVGFTEQPPRLLAARACRSQLIGERDLYIYIVELLAAAQEFTSCLSLAESQLKQGGDTRDVVSFSLTRLARSQSAMSISERRRLHGLLLESAPTPAAKADLIWLQSDAQTALDYLATVPSDEAVP